MSFAVQVWSSVFLVFIQSRHETTAAYVYVKKMQKTNVSMHSNHKGLDLHYVPVILAGIFCYNIKIWSFYMLICNLMPSSMIMTLVIFFQLLFLFSSSAQAHGKYRDAFFPKWTGKNLLLVSIPRTYKHFLHIK